MHELRTELSVGQVELNEAEHRERDLRETLLRISGAIQVLEELLAEPVPGHAATPPEERLLEGAGP
ncbi:MAG TPA: hypothetical protein VHN37_01975 [Actinomycetota bacterium]|nr:hypothetical protein [Actinomycetota bacterium]